MFKFIFIVFLTIIRNAVAEDCHSAQEALQSSLQQRQIEAATQVLSGMEKLCGEAELSSANTFYTDSLAKWANELVNNNQLAEAESLLGKAQVLTWTIASVRGDIEVKRKHWLAAAQSYGQAYDLLGDVRGANPAEQESLQKLKLNLHELANDAQLVYGKIDGSKNRAGNPQGIRLSNRGFGIEKTVVPVHFETDKAVLNFKGLESAEVMADFLNTNPNHGQVTIIGFADPRGDDDHNQQLSEQRAQTVATYLKDKGVHVSIQTLGKGETEPPKTNLQGLSEQDQLERWRRVELEFK